MLLTGFTDEAAAGIEGQIAALDTLGWRAMEARAVGNVLITDLSEEQFERFEKALHESTISVYCFGSGVANWAKPLSASPESSYEELTRAIPRMRRLHTRYIRIMSFAVAEDASVNEPAVVSEVIARMRRLVEIAHDSGIVLLHENCNTWAGRSYEHTLRLLDAIDDPSLRLAFDTGNPVFRKDIRGDAPYDYQNSWEFYTQVREFVDHVHIKDGRMVNDSVEFTWPGEGDGNVREILADLHQRGYDGAVSIEPHLAVVYHDDSVQTDDEVRFANFVEYGRRLESILEETGWGSHTTAPRRP